MRDIRDDLLERARFLEREMTIAEEDYYRAVALAQTALRAKLAALSTRLLADNYRAFLADFLESDQIR
jgi:hypothetical protein